MVQSPWFYNKVRDRIVAAAETATGGRVEIGRFRFDWHTMTATLTGFTIRGTEPVNGPPLLHADDIVVGLKIVSILKRDIDIALLRIDKPQAFLLVAADGTTNIPNPKTPSKSNKPGAETILDLAVGRFEVNNGSADIHGAGQPPKTQAYSVTGNNLHSLFTFDAAVPRYHGDISMAPFSLTYGDYKPLPAAIGMTIAMEKNRLIVEKSRLSSGDSTIEVNGKIEDFTAPVATAEYKAKVSLKQAGALLKLRSRQSGWLEATGSASYKNATVYAISGLVKAYAVDYQAAGMNLRNLRAQAKIDGGPKSISIDDIKAYALGGEIRAKAEIKNFETFKVNGELHRFDVRQLASLATRQKIPYDASLAGPVFAEGKIADLKNNRFIATARLGLSPSGSGIPVHGLIDAKYNGLKNTVDLGQSYVALPNTRLAVSGILGQQLSIQFTSSNLNDLLPAIQVAERPGQATPTVPVTMSPQGQVTFNGTVTGPLANPAIAGHLAGSNFVVQAQSIDALRADIAASKSNATVTNGSMRQNTLAANFSGSVGLRNWSPDNDEPVTASLALQNARLENLLALAGQTTVPASGTLTASAKISGTVANPSAIADLTLAHGAFQGEPFDRITAHMDAPNRTTQTLTSQWNAGLKQVNLKAAYAHSATDFIPGNLTFHVDSNNLALNKIVTLNQREPDLTGTAKLNADGTLSLSRDKSNNPAVAVTKVNGSITASGLQLAGRRLGDLSVTADTLTSGGSAPVVQVKLRSNLADANITADGHWTLAGDYPGSATLQFTNLHLEVLRRLVLTPEQAESVPVGGSIQGTLNVSGPAAKPEQLQASLEIPRIEIHPVQTPKGAAGAIDLTVRNSGPIRVTLANNVVHIENARITAQDSTFEITGSTRLSPHPDLNLQLNGDINLAILQLIDSSITSSGSVTAHATARGDFSNPVMGGSLQLKNANLAVAGLPNGFSNANGNIAFTGTQAFVRDLTAESGGGKVRFGGFASFAGGNFSFRLRAAATGVRVRYPQGISTVADAQLTLVGNTTRSVLSGNLTIDRLAFNPRTDLGSMLSSASAPQETPSANSGVANNVQLDVQIQTSPDITFESSYTESIEADANLRLRGSLTNPALLGRINITQGDIAFFGNKYTINQGSVSFFNPVRIEPILNIDLETVARGVDVTLTVSGPVTKLNVSYRSDPPLQFSDIVALLATGRTPTTHPLPPANPLRRNKAGSRWGRPR